jgi:two-component system chemotaxis response regulator CheY
MMQKILSAHGDCATAVDGEEAVNAFRLAWEENRPYDLICMDIMMPRLDGQEALRRIREMEREMHLRDGEEAKVIMTTALGDPGNVVVALYQGGASSYLVKPISKQALLGEVRKLGLIR